MDQLALWLDRLNANLAPVLMTAGVLMAASLSIFLLKRLLQTRLLRVEALFHLPHDISLRITRLVTGTVWLITGILILDIWGVNVGGLWTFLVSTAAVIGVGFLATWTIVSNVTASFFITVWRPFQFGDTVEILPENLRGQVVDRNFMYVILREDDGAEIKIPNNFFFQKIIRVMIGGNKSQRDSSESK